MNNAPPAVGTVQGGYRFKGGDPAQEGSWEQVEPIDVSSQYGAGARQLPNGRIERVGPKGGVTSIGSVGGSSEASPLVGADARARFMTGLGPLKDAQANFAAAERDGNPINRDWGAALIDGISENPITKNLGDAAARFIGGQDYQNFSQARSTYESALLPILSGAAVTPSEAERLIRADVPQWNDTPETLARKARNRAQRINAVAQGVGQDAPYDLKPLEMNADTGLPSYNGIRDAVAGIYGGRDETGGPSGPRPGDVMSTVSDLAPGDTPESLQAQGYAFDPQSQRWVRTRQEQAPGFSQSFTPEGALAERKNSSDWWRKLDGFVRGAADTLTFGFADELAAGADALIGRGNGQSFDDRYASNLAVQRGLDRADSQDIPLTRLGGQIGGAFAAPGAAASGRFVASAPNAATAIARGGLVGGGFGAAYGIGNADQNRLQGAIDGGLAGAVTGGALAGVGRGASASRRLFGGNRKSPDVQTLIDNGVFVTPGAQAGGLGKSIEDLAQRAPILGTAIRGARERGVSSLNRAVGNRALSNINEGVPANIEPGAESVDYVARQLGAQFDRAADMVPEVAPDATFFQNVSQIAGGVNDLSESAGRQFQNILQDRLSRLNGPVSGAQLRKVESEIGKLASQVDDQMLSGMLTGVQNELQDLLGRANPEAGQILNNARAGWREYATMRRASQAAGGNPFTPSQLLTAVRSEDTTVGNGATARGLAPLQDLARAAKNVMPDGFGNPGTADALGYGSLGALSLTNPMAGAATAGGLAAAATPYMLMGRKIVESLPARPSPAQAQEAVKQLSILAQQDPRVSQLLTYVLNTSRVALPGAAGAMQAQAQ